MKPPLYPPAATSTEQSNNDGVPPVNPLASHGRIRASSGSSDVVNPYPA